MPLCRAVVFVYAFLSTELSHTLVAATDFVAKGFYLVGAKDYDGAISALTEALHTRQPAWRIAAVHVARGDAHAGKGDLLRAHADYQRALAYAPTTVNDYHNRASIYRRLGNYRAAAADLTKASEMQPKSALHLNDLAWLRATATDSNGRNGREAIALATRACEMTKWKEPDYIDTLAAANAEAGDFERAIQHQLKVLQMKPRSDRHRPSMEARLALYRQRQPYHRRSRTTAE